MRQLRQCGSANLNTGVSRCAPDFGKVKGALVVAKGIKLPDQLDADTLEEMAHADRPNRLYGILNFVEYAKNGGESQVSATGYGPEQFTGISAMRDTFTLDRFYPELMASLIKVANTKFDVYYFDEDLKLYGINDGTGILAGIPMANIYPDATPHATSSAQSTMTVNFSHLNAKRSFLNFDYKELDFNPEDLTLGLIEVKVEKEEKGFKIYEAVGGNDITGIYGPLIQSAGADVIDGQVSAVSYDANDNIITATGVEKLTLKSPKELFEKGIKGIEQVA